MLRPSPRERYESDPHFHELVCVMESFLERAQFTPSELREASILAAINHELRHVRQPIIDPQLANALETLDRTFASRRR